MDTLTPIFSGRIVRIFVRQNDTRNIVYISPIDASLRLPHDMHASDFHFMFCEASRFFQHYKVTPHTYQLHTHNKLIPTMHLQVHLPRGLYLKLARFIGFAVGTVEKDEDVSSVPTTES